MHLINSVLHITLQEIIILPKCLEMGVINIIHNIVNKVRKLCKPELPNQNKKVRNISINLRISAFIQSGEVGMTKELDIMQVILSLVRVVEVAKVTQGVLKRVANLDRGAAELRCKGEHLPIGLIAFKRNESMVMSLLQLPSLGRDIQTVQRGDITGAAPAINN